MKLNPISHLLPEVPRKEISLKSYMNRIESGDWDDRFVFGILDKTEDYHSVDLVKDPGVAFIGGMGSGKSVSGRFSVSNHMMVNGHKTVYFMIDIEKGMTDYKMCFDHPSAIPIIKDPEKTAAAFDLIYAQSVARGTEFYRVGAQNIYDYERIKKDPSSPHYDPNFTHLARILVVIEEFGMLMLSKIMDFDKNRDKEGTMANQFILMQKVARAYGISFVLLTQRATYDDIPSVLKTGISSWLVFKVNNPGDASAAGMPHAEQIMTGQNGRCAVEKGFMQFPFLNYQTENLLRHYRKPFKATLLGITLEELKTGLMGSGSDGLARIKPLAKVLSTFDQFNLKTVADRVLSLFGFVTSPQGNPSLVADLIAEKDGERYAVVLNKAVKSSFDGSSDKGKNPEALEDALSILKVNKVISINFSGNDPMKNLVAKVGGYSVSTEELKRIGEMTDNKAAFSSEEEYKALFDKLTLSKPPHQPGGSETKPLMKGRINKDDESLDDLFKRI
nr:hypothetical protein BdHM001_35570 [Bdellovibrio sp. HM001]